MPAFLDLLLRALPATDVACLRIPGGGEALTALARRLIPPVQDAGIAVLLDDAALVRELGADGMHADDPGSYAAARKLLGDRLSIGVECPLERHTAMEIGEAGADYVQFRFDAGQAEETLELVRWWSEMMTVPSVIACPPAPESARLLAAAGADFVAPDPTIWQSADPLALLRQFATG